VPRAVPLRRSLLCPVQTVFGLGPTARYLSRCFPSGDRPASPWQIVAALTLCGKVTVFGFGSGPRGSYQYYRLMGTERPKGNPVHSFDLEKGLVMELSREGLLTFCHAKSPPGCGRQLEEPGEGG